MYQDNLFVKTSKTKATCLCSYNTPCFEQMCDFSNNTQVEPKEVTITVH